MKPYSASLTLNGNQNALQVNCDANKAYLIARGLAKTPRVLASELKLREQLPDVDWSNIQARHESLLTLKYDIFDVNRDKDFTGAASPIAPSDAGAELLDGISFEDIPEID